MKTYGNLIVGIAAGAVASCACAATSWTDYFDGTPPTEGTVIISSGDEVEVTDAEMAASAACTVNVAADARLLLNTSTFPTFTFGAKCYGTVEKVSSDDWALASRNQGNFKGTYVVSGGTLNLDGTYYRVFGGVETVNNGNVLYATNGTTLAFKGGSCRLGALPIHLGGSMTFNKTKFNYSVFDFLTLEGDSSLTLADGGDAFVDQFDAENPALIDLNGHNLTIDGMGKFTFKNGSFRGAGDIIVNAGLSTKAHMVYLENFTMEGGAGDVLDMGNYSGLATTTPIEIKRTVQVGNLAVRFPGPGWTTLAGGVSGDADVVSAFVTNVVGNSMVVLPGRSIVGAEGASGDYSSPDDRALWIGHCATGGLGVVEGMVVSNKLMVGGTSNSKQYQIGCGTVRQTGGEICIFGAPTTLAMRNSSTIGWSAHGYYEITGGVTRVIGNFGVGMASPGIIAQYGGLFEQVPHPDSPATRPSAYFTQSANDSDANGIPAVAYVAGGTMKLGGVILSYGKTSESVMTVTGAGSLIETPARIYTGYLDGIAAWVNINDGGTLATPYFAFAKNVDSRLYVNFDGGVLKVMPAVTGESELSQLFGIPGGAVPQVSRVTVGAGGATIDTNGRSMSADVPLAAPTGNAVVAIPFEAETGWTVAPYVKIVDEGGEGAGATAFADFDSATGTLKGFRVTSGGWNYTSATAKVYVNKTIVREIACTFAPAPTTGRFVKTGEGTLTLTAANTYGGDTVISNGTLKAGVAGAFPAGSRIVMSGGKIAVANGVAFPSELTIDMELEEGSTYVLADSFSGTLPSISGAPEGWVAVAKDGSLVLRKRRGFVMSVR